MNINYIKDKGSGAVMEDCYVAKSPIFGVFDGATSLDKYTDSQGQTGGFLAASTVRDVFSQDSHANFVDLAVEANEQIRNKMVSAGVDISKKANLWSTSAAVVRLNENSFDWVQIADSLILIIKTDNSYELLVTDYDHDEEMLTQWKHLGDKKQRTYFRS